MAREDKSDDREPGLSWRRGLFGAAIGGGGAVLAFLGVLLARPLILPHRDSWALPAVVIGALAVLVLGVLLLPVLFPRR